MREPPHAFSSHQGDGRARHQRLPVSLAGLSLRGIRTEAARDVPHGAPEGRYVSFCKQSLLRPKTLVNQATWNMPT
jgi:hypothetical protein